MSVRELSCVHDSYLCDKMKGGHWRPFPTQREEGEYNFVGAAGPMKINRKCPEQCRPEDHELNADKMEDILYIKFSFEKSLNMIL